MTHFVENGLLWGVRLMAAECTDFHVRNDFSAHRELLRHRTF